MENSHAWLGASTSSIAADSYQYQLQSMWQKCWNTNQNLMHHLRFRERGPLKSWRPETMAEAIFSVLKEGLSLSQAARKYDIPYPTFVLYANRVHNMLGPSIDGGTDLRPKGRGRPQRILLGIWPDDHIKGVIKTVVFRDAKELKEESMHLQYGRHSPVFPFQEGPLGYPGGPCANGMPPQGSDSMSPEATAAAVAAVAHNLRQQMQMAAAAHHPDSPGSLFNLPSHLQVNHPSISGAGTPLPKSNSPTSSNERNNSRESNNSNNNGNNNNNNNNNNHNSGNTTGIHNSNTSSQRHSSHQSMLPNPNTLASLAGLPGLHMIPGLSNTQISRDSNLDSNNTRGSGNNDNTNNGNNSTKNLNQHSSDMSSHHHQHHHQHHQHHHKEIPRNDSPMELAHDLRMSSPDNSPLNSHLQIALEPSVNLSVGVSGMRYKSSRGYSSSPHSDHHLFQDDIAELVSAGNNNNNSNNNNNNNNSSNTGRNCPPNFKEPSSSIKIEPMTECRSE
ncbi:protein bric-a-brac 1-like isoform X3 [Condylostylus longicornis]|uniref:protein bric-a-brac 1-like isoform X3 n=1 Tax=Condylostylus longicornis TaxID=2530218 RepID=UPI00244DA92E|nr:protein bric-a-brac 1-like isoform X3 [Condylostylus longicornis]